MRAELRATERKQEELIAAARERVDRDEARRVILERMYRLLTLRYDEYLAADALDATLAVELVHDKYAVPATMIEDRRKRVATELQLFLSQLGYA